MKIAMLAQSGSVHTGRWCTGLKLRGHEIYLISNSSVMKNGPDVETIFLPGSSAFAYFANIPKVKRLIKKYQPDIVHSHYASGFGLWGAVQNCAPLVLSVWGTDILDAKRKPLTFGTITRRALKKAAAVTATSEFLVNSTISFYPPVKSKIVRVPFGIPIPRGVASREYINGPTKFIFTKLFLANYAPDLILKAFARALPEMPQASLRMIGGGPMFDQLVDLRHELGIDNHVSIEDFIPHRDASQAIREADIMLMPSHNESFGVAAVEAASFGIPVIATNVGGIPEVVRDKVNGLLINPGDVGALSDAMIELANNPALRKRMGEEGMKIASENYDEQACLDKMEAIYQKVAGS
ncbi:MAG: glycosyltransferase family 4 protein [candidate division Zixibacteria bacterium]|nr:glycosyltransferase family 4 protein [candidate division Zixibacteria bacterium]